MMIMPLGRVFQAYTATQNALGAVLRIREITSLPEEEHAPVASRAWPRCRQARRSRSGRTAWATGRR